MDVARRIDELWESGELEQEPLGDVEVRGRAGAKSAEQAERKQEDEVSKGMRHVRGLHHSMTYQLGQYSSGTGRYGLRVVAIFTASRCR